MSMESKKILPSDNELARDSFRVYKKLQKKYYKNLTRCYSVWMKISSGLIIACLILFSLSQQQFFIWMSGAYLLTGLIATALTTFMREMYHRYYKLEAVEDASAEVLDSSLCTRKGKRYVLYRGRRYPRVGCEIEGKDPGFLFVSCDAYSYIVEVKEYTGN